MRSQYSGAVRKAGAQQISARNELLDGGDVPENVEREGVQLVVIKTDKREGQEMEGDCPLP